MLQTGHRKPDRVIKHAFPADRRETDLADTVCQAAILVDSDQLRARQNVEMVRNSKKAMVEQMETEG